MQQTLTICEIEPLLPHNIYERMIKLDDERIAKMTETERRILEEYDK